MKKFKIDKKYVTSVRKEENVIFYCDTGEQIEGMALSHIDHPKFTELRDKLESEGYIKTERLFWNGDRVLKPFYLNGTKFNKGQQFSCASALSCVLYRKYENKKAKVKK